ncbi:MAG TPA: ABC transporter permease [Candidatus Saccharimonadia bacterium]|nr:ABC transporter permease [Candidatus Saccharimonadia bacterium]
MQRLTGSQQPLLTATSAGRLGRPRVGHTLATFSRRYPVGMVAALVLLMIVLVAVLAPLVAPYDPNFQHFTDPQQAPSATYLLGTDYEGRDILSRLIYGGQVSLEVAVLSVLLGTMVGSAWGVVSAYLGGKVDLLSQRMVEVVMAFPTMVLAMIFLIALGGGIWTVIIAIAVTRLPFGVRVIRSVTLAIKELAYVDAARAVGASDLRIMARHIVPQCMPAFLVLATAHLGTAIVIEAGLGFLGIGITPPTASWGNMLGGVVANTYKPLWWLVVFPGLAISLTVLAVNLLGDALRDILDPKMRGW